MADTTKQIKVSEASNGAHLEEDLPPPPPSAQQELIPATGDQSPSFIPVPPPKETFTTFYHQRQKNELKRLYRHMHPELRKNLEHVVNEELVEVLSSEDTQLAADAGYQGEVQSMRWIFENWTLDSIGDPHATRKTVDEEAVTGGNVRSTSSVFEQQGADRSQLPGSMEASERDQVRGDVHTATWLFETQPLDSLNKIYPEEGELVEAVLKEPVHHGDVTGARRLFESYPLDSLGRCSSVEDFSLMKLKSEIQEQRGDIQKTVKLFQTEPCCAIRDGTGAIHEIKSICREEIESNAVKTARWLFETQPLDVINRKGSAIQIIRGISLEEAQKGGVDKKRWMFETQPLDTIHESIQVDQFQAATDVVEGADVTNKCQLFETQTLTSLKGESSEEASTKEEIVKGDVKSTLWLFETQPMETLKDNYEVSCLKKVTVTEEERGTVQNRRNVFETHTLDSINKETSEEEITSGIHEIEKGDVKSFKQLFETIPLGNISRSENEPVEKSDEVVTGNVKSNRALFETMPLYAIKDCSGNYHEVTTVSREQIVNGNVQNYKWMFETRPLDQFEEGKRNVEIIKGITRQEDQAADVKTAKWLFETQPLDTIHSQVNETEVHSSVQKEVLQQGDVKTCKWLFETQPMDILYEKSEKKPEEEFIPKTDVKSHTWLFETQPLDTIKESNEPYLKLCSVSQDDVKTVDVKTVRHVFETESLDNITTESDTEQDVRYVSKVDIQSGDVSRVKEIFETKSLDEIGTASVKISEEVDQHENIQVGSVHKFTWLFENRLTEANKGHDESRVTTTCTARDVKGGDVGNKKFIFETFSLDQIHEEDKSLECTSVSDVEPTSKGDVKSCTMLFETQPLYAIRDKDGQFHEVTTVKKEEIMSADVRGARWMFETKPLDTIKPQDEIFVIRAVTQEDVLKGDVKTARWRFETQPLDSLTSKEDPKTRPIEEVQRGDVKLNKQLFESQEVSRKKCVRMVSVTDVQQGDVRTSTWLFENQPIDSLKGELQENVSVQTVHREDNQKGDVKRCTWLFETQPLDALKEPGSSTCSKVPEEMPQTDVKSTTWLFESTPLDKLSYQSTAETETVVESVKETLYRLHHFNAIHSHGIAIEANEMRSVTMAKYQLVSTGPEIQKEEVVEGNIKGIMLQLLQRTNVKPQGVLLKEDEQGNVQVTQLKLTVDLPSSQVAASKEHSKADVAQAIESLLNQDKSLRKGILIQETERGYAEMTVYSLFSHFERQEVVKGDVKSTIGCLLASAKDQRTVTSCRLEQNEKGNVHLYKSCIEKGDLQFLKSLQADPVEDETDSSPKEQIEIVQGDVQGAKRHLNQHKELTERTVVDIVPGDVKNVKKVFSCESAMDQSSVQKEEIICGDISSAKQSLGQAINQPIVVEKEEIVSGDIKATLQALERAKNQSMQLERETIVPGTIYDLNVTMQETTASTDTQETEGKQQTITRGQVEQERRVVTQKTIGIQQSRTVQSSMQTNVQRKETACVARIKESASSSTSQQKITSVHQKVSDPGEMQGSSVEPYKESEVTESADASSTRSDSQLVLSVVNPLLHAKYDEQCAQEETEADAVVRGDVKAAIKSLQSAATGQKPVEKEDVVRGNLQAALQSLEKSSVNVTKGDFKAAMIYRNSGQSYSDSRKKSVVCSQTVVVSDNSFDTESSPSVSVTDGEQQPHTALNKTTVTPNQDENANKPSTLTSSSKSPPPLPPKSCEKPAARKPALPPKPQHLDAPCSAPGNRPRSSRKPEHIRESQQTPVIPPKVKQQVSLSPPPLPTKSVACQDAAITNSHKASSKDTLTVSRESKHCDMDCGGESGVGCEDINPKKDQAAVIKTFQGVDKNYQKQELNQNTITVDAMSAVTSKITHCVAEREERSPQKINPAEEIQEYIQCYSEDSEIRNAMTQGFQAALQNFGGKKKGSVHVSPPPKTNKGVIVTAPSLPKKVKVIQGEEKKEITNIETKTFSFNRSSEEDNLAQPENKVVLRQKKVRRETENERRERLSVHKDEIMRGNVQAAMDIFENLRKREQLQIILSKVEQIEGETCKVDVRSLKTLFENVPEWIVAPGKNKTFPKPKGEVKVDRTESLRDETESMSSVEVVFGDLERASEEIMNLKEQTLARLMDIEEAIKKALYSVSNLKSESDIAGLSGLFKESLGTEQSTGSNNIRKICIASSKAKMETGGAHTNEDAVSEKVQKPGLEIPVIKPRASSPSSPSYISIQSAARKPTELPKDEQPSSAAPEKGAVAHSQSHRVNPSPICSPLSQRRQKSVLEVKTVPEPAGIVGTKTVTEKYEETDCFGNRFISSKTSTIVTKQSETKTSSTYEVVASPTKYDMMASPLVKRPVHPFSESAQSNCKVNEGGAVFVTFGHPKNGKK
ncbi:XIRP1 protein, partial [Amia calva]|nr:XIRP1 protein [Amia calva]